MRSRMSLQDTKIPRSTVSSVLPGQCLNSRWLSKNEGTIGYFNGKVYIYKRVQPGEPFLPEQIIEDPQSHIGDGFGYSISVHSNTLAVASPYRKGRFAAEGVIAVYERENEDQLFYFHSHLRNRDGRASDRLGMSVSIEDKTLVASYHEEFRNLIGVFVNLCNR